MASRYLLPCSCGEKVAVESRQAGQRILCSCGQTLDVPTMQGMRQLEKSADSHGEPRRTSSLGGVGIGIGLLGCIILASGGAYAYWVHSRRPILSDVNQSTPWDTWLMWQDFQEGVRLPEYAETPYHRYKKINDQSMALAIVIIAVGFITTVCGVIIAVVNGASQRRRARQRAP